METATQRRVSAIHIPHETPFTAERVLESMAEAVLAIDLDGSVQYLNAAARRQLALGQLPEAHELGNALLLRVGALLSSHPGNACPQSDLYGVLSFLSSEGEHRAISFVAHPIPGSGHETAGFVFRMHCYPQERSKLLLSLLHDATHDELTGLVNRRELIKRLRCLVNRRRCSEQHALFFMDLDKFKQINDTCGHRAGDEALRQVAALLRSHLRKRDTLGRLGGDEFVLLMEHCPEAKAVQTAHLLSAAVRDHIFVWGGARFHCGISIGMVTLAGFLGNAEDLLAKAEAACYEAKRSQGATRAVFRQHCPDTSAGLR